MHRLLWTIGTLVAALVLVAPVAEPAAGGPQLAFAPSMDGRFDFGRVAPGERRAQAFTLTNSGRSATGMLTIELSRSLEFTKAADDCTETSLGPGKSCSVTVVYAPSKPGESVVMLTAASSRRPVVGPAPTLTLQGFAPRGLYWANGDINSIGRADFDGQNVNQSFISLTGQHHPTGLAVDSAHIYWIELNALPTATAATIGRADLNGQNVNQSFISLLSIPASGASLAVDSSHIYWALAETKTIARADLNGQNVNQNFISTAIKPHGLAVEPPLCQPICLSGHIYWSTGLDGDVGRADLNGQNVNNSFISITDIGYLAVDSSHIYMSVSNGGTIERADLNGQNVNHNFINFPDFPVGLAVDCAHVYWGNIFGATIGRADLNGANQDTSFISGTATSAFGAGVAVDAC